MDSDAALHVELVGVVAVGAVVVVLAAAASGACGADAFPDRWRKRAQVDDVENALGDATLMTYEQAAAAAAAAAKKKKKKASSSPAEGADTCAICWDEYAGADKVRVVLCGHFFHAGCVDRWLREKRHCPLCRGALSLPPLPKPGCRPMPPRTSRPAVSTATAAASVVG